MIARPLAALMLAALAANADAAPPRIEAQGDAYRLIVQGKPMLMLGGELGNSSASSEAYMAPHWARLRAMHLNTVLSPVSWELIEPSEGKFDFASVDMLIRNARAHDLHLVFLWFGAWKNSMSSYVPAWVKRDQARFPRAELPDGSGVEILSPLATASRDADAKAFAALMAHIKAVDGDRNTVLMVQVENEIAMLPVARDYSAAATAAFHAPVPQALTDYLVAHRATLVPWLKATWEANGARTQGDWTALFGRGDTSAEIFTAWNFARYTDAITRAGKQHYALPMYVNVALNRPGKLPGEYPSGGPLPHLIDVWKAGAPALDMLSPDVYFPNFVDLAANYRRPDNPMFIPEANNAEIPEAGANGFYAVGALQTMGYSPFQIETIDDKPDNSLAQAYSVLEQLSPAILSATGTGKLAGFKPRVLFDGTVLDAPVTQTMGDYALTATFVVPFMGDAKQQTSAHGAIAIQTGPEEYLLAGSGVVFTFKPVGPGAPIAGIDSAWEGTFDASGTWVDGRRLNGDQIHQGRHIRLEPGRWQIQKVRLYRYR
ncbi:GH35 family beta-galactosidase [Sphingomonas nostoxanthinifaciens]|uniref:GH35 family beta-galactosidase n=1 Tax=Sphingomonas nostoxanthinifaciens TaxID=2872652 RepID=UPI001CC1E75A|nr:DUF5597 domain-containing protein [Sphingomonas nostoxanthinifaciens]UAK26134.1 DUF5597 domain-containing protein [Sphingomonas nostoxanthinifaciens]